jgi:N utilization substance protein B
MVMHSLQPFVESSEIKIEKLDDTWDESREFLETLFSEVLSTEEELTELMIPKLKNWEVERISEIDLILIKLGLVELINYPGIPIKVTINEVIEIAKNYSSEKSGIFINGVLDALSKKLIEEGTIRKSGRGMIDNK